MLFSTKRENPMRTVKGAARAARDGWRTVAGACRSMTAAYRTLPDFLIVGEAKAGTTTLYDLLSRHPQVAPAAMKEVHFFDLRFSRGVEWYRAQFPLSYRVRGGYEGPGARLCTGEASPYYMLHPHAPRRIKALLPHVRLIVLVRNPIERAYSHYHHETRAGRESLSFEEAIDREPERLAGERERMLADEHYSSAPYRRNSYLRRGQYADQIDALHALFDPRQVLVVCSEELFKSPHKAYGEVISFLGLPAVNKTAIRRQNSGSYAPMSAATRSRLVAYFEPHNQRLYQLLDRDLRWA
jgi:hypothetical protein